MRQVDAGEHGAAAPAEGRRGRPGEVLVSGRGRADDGLGRAARGALGRGRDRLPGRAALAQPGTPDRDPDRRAHPPARARALVGGGRRPRRCAPRAGRAARGTVPGLSPPALGGPAAAGDDRDGAGLPAAADRRRRADDGARRHGAGADPRPDLRPGEGPRGGAGDHQPRPVGARRRVRPGGGHVRRPGRRGAARPSRSSTPRPTPTPGRCRRRSRESGTRRPGTRRPVSPETLPIPTTSRRGAPSRRGAARDRRLHRRRAAAGRRSGAARRACIRAGECDAPR